VKRIHTLAEAQALLPVARARIAEVAIVVAELEELVARLQAGLGSARSVEELATLQLAVEDAFAWFEGNGVQVKSLRPALLDFPARAIRDGVAVEVLLCWRDDEETLAYYHPLDGGYQGREPVAMLDQV
jgi:hypothetical protein